MIRLFCAVTVLVLAIGLQACGGEEDPEMYRVRGEVVRAEFEGLALLVDHESIPGVIDASRTSLRLQSPEDGRNLQPGDRIVFTFVNKTEGPYMRDVERLPASVELDLRGIQARTDTVEAATE